MEKEEEGGGRGENGEGGGRKGGRGRGATYSKYIQIYQYTCEMKCEFDNIRTWSLKTFLDIYQMIADKQDYFWCVP